MKPAKCPCGSKACIVEKNILTERKEWALEHYHQGSGSLQGLHDFAKRYNLAYNLKVAYGQDRVSTAVVDALNYLLQMENFTEDMI